MLKLRCLIALVVLAVGFTVGCSDDNKGTNSNGNSVPSELIATWTFQSATVGDMTIDLEYILPWEEGTAHARIRINDDKTCVFKNVAADSTVLLTETGSFSVDGNSFSLTGFEELPISGGNWAVSGDSLTLTAPVAGRAIKLIATR